MVSCIAIKKAYLYWLITTYINMYYFTYIEKSCYYIYVMFYLKTKNYLGNCSMELK